MSASPRPSHFILCLLLSLSLLRVFAQPATDEKLHFTRIGTSSGLSQSTINTIVKDRSGFMWFGTNDGLNRYDGYHFKIYRNIPGDTSSLPYNLIRTLFTDSKGNLWVGTLGGGLAKYNAHTDSFERYPIGLIQCIFEDHLGRIWVGTFDGLFIITKSGKAVRAETLEDRYKIFRGKTITAFLQDRKKDLWIGTKKGLYLMRAGSGKDKAFFHPGDHPGEDGNEIGDIAMDQKGTIWAGTKSGLYRYNNQTLSFSAAQFLARDKKQNLKATINALSCDSDNRIWIATDNGLGNYDSARGKYKVLVNDAFDAQSLSRNSVNALYADKQMLWVGTALGGINKYERNNSMISHYRIYNPANQMANTNVVTSFASHQDNKVFIGTDGGGLFIWDMQENKFKSAALGQSAGHPLGESILSLLKSRNGEKLWIGTYSDGLFELNLKSNTLSRFHTANHTLTNNSVYSILEDQQSNIWAGTNGGGVTVINKKGQAILQFNQNQPGTINNNFIRSLSEDQQGKIWIGTYGGINIFDPAKGKFINPDPQIHELTRHLVCALFLDSYNKMWIGTQGSGLFIYDARQKKLKHFTVKEGLSNNNISSISAQKGLVWISTSRGLNKLNEANPHSQQISSGRKLDGREFTMGASLSCPNGKLLLGSVDGFHLLYPPHPEKDHLNAPLSITDFHINPNSSSSNPDDIKTVRIRDGQVELKDLHSSFSIEFASLDYQTNARKSYACRMSGLDQEWQYLGEEHKVSYHNLDPGKYVFEVKVSNSGQIWSGKVTRLRIIVHPPLWRTPLAYLGYGALLLLILWMLLRELNARRRLKKELQLEKLNADRNREMNLLKLNFFTSLSHELRTPLSLIIDPLRKITQQELSPQQTQSLSSLAFRHALRLLTLVNELLDFRKNQEVGSLLLKPLNIQGLVEDVLLGFQDQSSMRNIQLITQFKLGFTTVNLDADKMQKILSNLVSNAIKFTPDGGRILLSIRTYIDSRNENLLEIIIQDNGPGIPQEYKTRIFEMFFQTGLQPQVDTASSGIGLALVKELTEKHKGKIYENGIPGEGARFVILMPAGEQAGIQTKQAADIHAIPEIPSSTEANQTEQSEAPTILLIEDHPEMRDYIAVQLSAHYQLEVASGGEEGYQKAISLIPDLIISDVMMAQGDGMELCNNIKNNEKTSHIPVIMLTAKDADESKMEGFKSGADDYISKPFNSELLLIRIENILNSRQKLMALQHAMKSEDLGARELLSEIDQSFLKKARQVILDHLDQASFDVSQFAELLEMNRRQLSRKLKAITDQTPQEFIIKIRLETAIQLMLYQSLNISQAAYQVGFSEPANFSRSFARVYGQSPKAYMSEKHGKNNF